MSGKPKIGQKAYERNIFSGFNHAQAVSHPEGSNSNNQCNQNSAVQVKLNTINKFNSESSQKRVKGARENAENECRVHGNDV